MSNIFISYRREDSGGYAGRIYDRVTQHFRADQVFMDVDTVQPGVDFVEAIADAVKSCAVLIAVIGKSWLNATDEHGRRLDNPDDLVRVEICAALERRIRVIPVLVNGASMPHPKDLPDCLRPLTRRSAVEISHTRFAADAELLVQALGKALAGVSPEAPKAPEHADRRAQADDDVLRRMTALSQNSIERLGLPAGIYAGVWLAPDASTVYLTRFREKVEYANRWDLIGYDMTTGQTSLLGDVGTDSHYYTAFDGRIFYKTAEVERYKTHRILCFEGARRVAGPDERLIVSFFGLVRGKLVCKVADRWFWRDARGAQHPLNLGRNHHSILWCNDRSGLAVLSYLQGGPASKPSEQLYEHRLVSMDQDLNVTNTLWVHADTNTCRFHRMRAWTENALLFVEKTDTNQDGRVTYEDQRNCIVKSLDPASGKVSTVVPDPLELIFIAGHPSGLILLADELAKDEHVRLEAYKDGMRYEVLNLRGGRFQDFCLDGQWATLIYKRVADTTGRGTLYDWEDESELFRIKL